jgi:hypothetical protein
MDVRQLVRSRRDRRPRHVLGRRPGAVHRAVERLRPRRQAREGARRHPVDRANGGLTDEGERVVERARRILHEIDDIAADIASLDDEVSGDARIGVIGTTARWLMPQLLTRSPSAPARAPHRAARAARHHSSRACCRASSTRRSSTSRSTTPSSSSSRSSPRTCSCWPQLQTPARRRDTMSLASSTTSRCSCPRRAPRCDACSTGLRRAPGHAARPGRDRRRPPPRLARLDGYGAAIVPATAAPRQLAVSAASTSPSCPDASSPGPDAGAPARAPPPRRSPAPSSTWCVPTPASSPASTSAATRSRSSAPADLLRRCGGRPARGQVRSSHTTLRKAII